MAKTKETQEKYNSKDVLKRINKLEAYIYLKAIEELAQEKYGKDISQLNKEETADVFTEVIKESKYTLDGFIELINKAKEGLLEDLTEEKRTYTKNTRQQQGGNQKLKDYDNMLFSDSYLFAETPTLIKENGGANVSISTDGGIFELTPNDKKIDTIIANMLERPDAIQELNEKGYIDRTLLNITDEFYNPGKTTHYSEDTLTEMLKLLYRNMFPLIFVYEDGTRAITPLINLKIENKKQNATPTVRIFKNQYINEYNEKIKGKRVTVYRPNLKTLGLQYKLIDSELSELVQKKLNDHETKFYFADFQKFYNADNRTEKKRFKEKLKTVLAGFSILYGTSKPKEIKKSPGNKNSESIGFSIRYIKTAFQE